MTAHDIHTQISNEIRQASQQLAEADRAVAADALLAELRAMSPAERSACWAGLGNGDRHQLAAACLRALGKPVTTDAVLLTVESLEDRWAPQPSGPAPVLAVEAAADRLATSANGARAAALGRARAYYRQGAAVEVAPAGYRIASATQPDQWYTVQDGACSCAAARYGLDCWHAALAAILDAATDAVATEYAASIAA